MPQHTTHKLPTPQQPQCLVYNEHTLCCRLTHRPAALGVIAVKKLPDLNQHHFKKVLTFFLPPHAQLRSATPQDFHNFNINVPTGTATEPDSP